MDIKPELHSKLINTMSVMKTNRQPWWAHWREMAEAYLPRRYVWLTSVRENNGLNRNTKILDSTATEAARTLASGLMNGITSPARPWFKLRIAGFSNDNAPELSIWLEEVERRMFTVFAESNFYNSLATLYLDLVVFGTAVMLIYEDRDSVIRCYNCALGEFYLAQDNRLEINEFGREIVRNAGQIVQQWGIENVSPGVKSAYKSNDGNRLQPFRIMHIIQPNDTKDNLVPKSYKYREVYWEQGATKGKILSAKGFNEMPGIFTRWETIGNESYGSSPAMDAYGDFLQLQQETMTKAQGLEKQVKPPMIADIALQHQPSALVANGITYVSNINAVGMKPAYQVQLPIAELSADIQQIQSRIRRTFHNDLFRMLSDLPTVRSATEVEGLKEEKLVLLGPVLDRFKQEGLDPAINRTFNTMLRANLLPPMPAGFENREIEVQYKSLLSVAQSSFSTIPTERFLAMVGQASALYPKAVNIPNIENLLTAYAHDIGVSAAGVKTTDELDQLNEAADQAAQSQQALDAGSTLVDSAKQLSETNVGGGANALQAIIGG